MQRKYKKTVAQWALVKFAWPCALTVAIVQHLVNQHKRKRGRK